MKNSFTVSPMNQKIHLKPGETYKGSITVGVPMGATEKFKYRVSLNPYSILDEAYTTDFKTASDWSRIVEWTTLENDSGEVSPNTKQKVDFSIKVPENAPGGGQYMMLAVTSDNPIADTNSFAVQNVYEMAALVYAEVEGEITRQGQILENQISGFVTAGKPYVLTRLSNTGNVHETADVTITVKNMFNGEMIFPKEGDGNVFETVVLPDTTRLVKREIDTMPPLGVFEVTQNVSFVDANVDVTSVMVICPIWFIFLILATLLSLIGVIIYTCYAKSKKKKKVVDF